MKRQLTQWMSTLLIVALGLLPSTAMAKAPASAGAPAIKASHHAQKHSAGKHRRHKHTNHGQKHARHAHKTKGVSNAKGARGAH